MKYTIVKQFVNRSGVDDILSMPNMLYDTKEVANEVLRNTYNDVYGKCDVIKLIDYDYLYVKSKDTEMYSRIIGLSESVNEY